MIEAGSLIRSLSGRPAARNFHTFVINEIGHGIVTGQFPVGSVLASDAVMMETYGVSRTVLREALKTLEAKGMVEARPKVGTRVTPSNRWSFFDPQVLSWHFYAKPDARFFESLFDVRSALEARAVRLAAERRTAEHVRLMKYWLHQMELADGNLEALGLSSLEIHRAVAESAGNALLRSVTGIVELTLALALKSLDDTTRNDYARATLAALTELVAAIEKGAPDAAAAAIDTVVALDNARATTLL
ncbi:FadR/GntR family transcriptional regulator [Devosia sp. J2-20]|jgi:DNA-binding FadR family transcriptional regulator|uniref:FadR family transcriptional regulator n=1 Tax=Devosia litorisediminis TaxID=2829817 RepID=A0A942E3L2_9HYPH|nr:MULTISPECIES: FadR/GntR family transcriptional regulator [Devosia]MBS3847588.1 FadR family transcriptional regulator [Devosia litorisediminis]MCZ4347050.1 FadR/GntR family transcriptional regulator [Devosia neptuniae]WDQ99289.1 FadR/GntR family transcriptional regulator [Devosia sp. J2-20]|tara:strand:+ start:873 stop:1610 length:738 start_codon:yes stop_codon:yes gene_type:complete